MQKLLVIWKVFYFTKSNINYNLSDPRLFYYCIVLFQTWYIPLQYLVLDK